MSNDQSLAAHAMMVEILCDEIEEADESGMPLCGDLIARFEGASTALSAKVDRWIGLLDAISSRLDLLKERKRRTTRAIKAGETLQGRLKEYLKFTLLQYAEGEGKRVPFQGTTGKIYLQNNPPGVKLAFQTTDKTIYKCIDKAMLELEPSINRYVKGVTVYVLDHDKLKADLDAGVELSWASLEQGCHVRTKG